MPDNWDDYTDEELEAIAAGGAPAPDAAGYSDTELAQIAGEQAPAPATVPYSESAVRGGLQGFPYVGPFFDEGSATLAALGVPDARIPYAPGAGLIDRYRTARDYYRSRNDAALEANPKTYRGTQLASGLVGGIAVPASGGASALDLAKRGAVQAGAAGLGYSRADLTRGEFLPAALETGASALAGAILTPAADKIVRFASDRLASTASGLRQAEGSALFRVAGGKGVADTRAVGGTAAAVETGLRGKEEGLIRPLDVFPGAMNRQTERVAEFARQSTDEIVQAIDDAGARIAVRPLQQALMDASEELRMFPSANSAALGRLNGFIEDLGNLADESGTLSARTLQTAKKTIDDFIKTWDPNAKSSLAQDLGRAIYRGVMEAQEQAVETAGGAAARSSYETAKRASQLAQRLETIQGRWAERQQNQLERLGGLVGTGAGVAGLAGALLSGDPARGLALYGAARTLTSPRTWAVGLSGGAAAADLLSRAAGISAPAAPSAGQLMIDALERRRLGAR